MFIMNIVPVLLLIVSTNAIGLPDDATYNRSYFKRATDEEFSTSIKQMEMISRITNGISLQQGLSRGTITNEELISELLNLGDINPSDIAQINTEELKKLVESIRKLSDTLLKSGSSNEIEARLDKLSPFVKALTDVESIEEPGQEFTAAVSKIENSKLNWNQFNFFAKRLIEFHEEATNLVNYKKNGNELPFDIVKDFNHETETVLGQDDLSSFEKELSGDSISKTQNKLKVFPTVVGTVDKFQNVQKDLSYDPKKDDTTINSLENSMNVLAIAFENMWNDLEVINIIEKLFMFRHPKRGNHDSKLIPGFSSDTSGLGLLSDDLKDSWMQTNIKEQTSFLEKVFQPFSILKEKTEKVDGFIGKGSDASFAGMKLVSSQVEYLSQFSHITGLSADILRSVLKSSVEAKKHLPNNRAEFEKLYNNIVLLCNRFTTIKEVFKVWKKLGLSETKNKLSELRTLAPLADKTKAAEQLTKIQNDENFKNVFKILEGAKKHIKDAKGRFNLKETAASISKDYTQMVTFVKKVNDFLKTIRPLRQFKKLTNAKSVFKDIGTIKSAVVNKEFGETVNIDPVIETIENTKSALKELDDSITSMKQAKGNEIDRLVGIADASENARSIGSSTKAVSSMNTFLELDTNKLEAAVKKLQNGLNAQASIENQNTLKTLAGLVIQISNFKQEIKSFKDSVQPITSSKLSDYSEIFEKAKSVRGITRDFLALSVLVGKLKDALPADKKLIDEIKDLLVTMDKLCLKYSKYQTVFDGSKNTLNNIDLLFTSLNAPIVSPPAKQVNTGTTQPNIVYESYVFPKKVVSESCWTQEQWEGFWTTLGYMVFFLVTLFIVLYFPRLWYLKREQKKYRKILEANLRAEVEERKNMKQGDGVPETTITPAAQAASKTPAATPTPKKT